MSKLKQNRTLKTTKLNKSEDHQQIILTVEQNNGNLSQIRDKSL